MTDFDVRQVVDFEIVQLTNDIAEYTDKAEQFDLQERLINAMRLRIEHLENWEDIVAVESGSKGDSLARDLRQANDVIAELKMFHSYCNPAHMIYEDHIIWEKWNKILISKDYNEKTN